MNIHERLVCAGVKTQELPNGVVWKGNQMVSASKKLLGFVLRDDDDPRWNLVAGKSDLYRRYENVSGSGFFNTFIRRVKIIGGNLSKIENREIEVRGLKNPRKEDARGFYNRVLLKRKNKETFFQAS